MAHVCQELALGEIGCFRLHHELLRFDDGFFEPAVTGSQCLLSAFNRGDVFLHREVLNHRPAIVLNRGDEYRLPNKLPVLLPVAEPATPVLPRGYCGPQIRVGGRWRFPAPQQPRVPAQHFLSRIPRDLSEFWIHILNTALGIGNQDTRRTLLDRLPKHA